MDPSRMPAEVNMNLPRIWPWILRYGWIIIMLWAGLHVLTSPFAGTAYIARGLLATAVVLVILVVAHLNHGRGLWLYVPVVGVAVVVASFVARIVGSEMLALAGIVLVYLALGAALVVGMFRLSTSPITRRARLLFYVVASIVLLVSATDTLFALDPLSRELWSRRIILRIFDAERLIPLHWLFTALAAGVIVLMIVRREIIRCDVRAVADRLCCNCLAVNRLNNEGICAECGARKGMKQAHTSSLSPVES